MKAILFTIFLISAASAQTQSTRSTCENAHFALGYVKLHHYDVTVTWKKVSDDNHIKLDEIIHSKSFKIIKVIESDAFSTYKIKESHSSDPVDIELLLEELKKIPTSVGCTYYNPSELK